MALRALLVHKAPKARKDHSEIRGRWDLKAPKETKGTRDHRAIRASKAHKVSKERRGMMEWTAPKDPRAQTALPVRRERKAHKEPKGLPATMGPMG